MSDVEPGRPPVAAVILDLDGVVVSTDELHARAWTELAERLGIPFDQAAADRLRGISRMESLELLLGERASGFDRREKEAMAAGKDRRYRELLEDLSPADLEPGFERLLGELRAEGIPIAIGSSSRNARRILARVGLSDAFDAIADGTRITRSKPDPEVFLLAASDLGVEPRACIVVEDADAGVEAARAAGMRVLAVGAAEHHPAADLRARDLTTVHATDLLGG